MFRIADLAIWPFNQLINTALQLDRETLDKLSPLAGKILAIEWRALQITTYIYIRVESVKLSFSCTKTPDALLSSNTPLPMIKLISTPQSNVSGEISIKGDVHFVQQMQQIFSRLSIDWEEHLSTFMGDAAANKAGQTIKEIKNWVKTTHENMMLNTTEFLQQEKQALPSRAEVEDFLKEVDNLRNDVERAAARIRLLAKKRDSA